VGTDQNQSPRKSRSPGKGAAASTSPFRSREVHDGGPTLQDVPGVLGAIEAVLSGGRALMLSRTSDGGAIAVHVLDNGQRFKQYASSQEELDEVFADLLTAYGEGNSVP
jgi:hypothetical protein